jgi:hypothetical protein
MIEGLFIRNKRILNSLLIILMKNICPIDKSLETNNNIQLINDRIQKNILFLFKTFEVQLRPS